jgi:hypothetical protein
MRSSDCRHVALLAGAATALFWSIACGSSCSGQSCGMYSRISATLAGTSPWAVTLCANEDCTTCDVATSGSGVPHEEGDASTLGSTMCSSWTVAPAAGGTPLLDIDAFTPPSYPEGASLRLNVADASGATVVEWKGTAHYMTHSVGGANCDNETTCRSFIVDIPAS